MPIIQTLMDVDFYKPTMAQVVWNYWRDIPVTYSFMNRTGGIPLTRRIPKDLLREELEHVRALRFSTRDQWWLRTAFNIRAIQPNLFSRDFLYALENVTLPPIEVIGDGDNYRIETSGTWFQTIWWETIVLSIVAELYTEAERICRGLSTKNVWNEGERRLLEKIALFKQHPEIIITDFGTRRRASQRWHRHVVDMLLHEIPQQVAGTSNVMLARDFNIRPSGTLAHEMQMVLYGLARSQNILNAAAWSQETLLRTWRKTYGEALSVALTDTFGTDFFLKNLTPENLGAWKGYRQDSGNPIEIGEKIVASLKAHGIDAKEKILLFSDGLTVEEMIRLARHFDGKIQVRFGWGTNLTNDLGIPPLSLVMKVTQAAGFNTVKLSDNPAKATGNSAEIARAKQEVGYKDRPPQKVIY